MKTLTLILALSFSQTILSPPAETRIALGGKKFRVEYSAPSMRGRKIFGGLVPYGQVWRAGANAPTIFYTGAPLLVADFTIPKGEFVLTVLPNPDSWTLLVYTISSKLIGKAPMKLTRPLLPIETFKITLDGEDSDGMLYLAWENTVASVPFKLK